MFALSSFLWFTVCFKTEAAVLTIHHTSRSCTNMPPLLTSGYRHSVTQISLCVCVCVCVLYVDSINFYRQSRANSRSARETCFICSALHRTHTNTLITVHVNNYNNTHCHQCNFVFYILFYIIQIIFTFIHTQAQLSLLSAPVHSVGGNFILHGQICEFLVGSDDSTIQQPHSP